MEYGKLELLSKLFHAIIFRYEFEKATEIYDKAIRYAERSNYEKGITIISLYKLDSLVLNNNLTTINDGVESIIDSFLKGDFNDPFCYEFIARYYRSLSYTQRALEVIHKGILKSNNNPTAQASLWHEAARIALKEKNFNKERLYRKNGNKLYSKLELYNRIVKGQIKEYSEGFSS